MKVVINRCFGGFSLSSDAMQKLHEQGYLGSEYDIERNDPRLVALVEEMGDAANGRFATLKVVEIPDGIEWGLKEYDGIEHIAEKHRTWS